MYGKGVNTSSRARTVPKDNDKIGEGALISVINFGTDLDNGTISIRAKFHGSDTFYSVPLDSDKYDVWSTRIKVLYLESKADFEEDDNDEIDF